MRQDEATLEKRDIQRYLRKQGLVATVNKANAAHLRAYGLAPDVVIDVGVNTGTPFLYQAFPDVPFVLIDPHAESRFALNGPDAPIRAQFYETALGAVDSVQVLNVPLTADGINGAQASLHTAVGPMARKFIGVEQRSVPVTTLDRIAAAHPGRVGLKIDTEGAEAEILGGAAQTLARCDFVILEVSLSLRFVSTSKPSTLFALLTQAGLEFRDVLRMPGDGKGGPTPRLMDALFTRWPAHPDTPMLPA